MLTICLILLNLKSLRLWLFSACLFFILGCFYAIFYEKFILNYTKITGKIFVDGFGKISEIKEKTDSEKVTIILKDLTLCKSDFSAKDYGCYAKKQRVYEEKDQKEYLTKKPKKSRKSTIASNFVNLDNYQEINREFLDKKENYQTVNWQEKAGQKLFPNPPPKISISLRSNLDEKNQMLEVNDIVLFRALFSEIKNQDLLSNFDFEKYKKLQKIGGYAFAIGDIQIVKKAKISNIDEYFLSLRHKISQLISKEISGDEGEILKALTIGKKDGISPELNMKIRSSGLAHLLAISGLHLSIVASIFFVLFRKILASSQYLALNFELKKISAILAILASFLYLKISGSPITAQRAFLMISLGFVAVFLDEKANLKRILVIVALALIIANPYVIFSISFQLSITAIISIAILTKFYRKKFQQSFLAKFFNYFLAIIVISLFVQIATAPILIKNFGNLPILGFLSNLVAIPLVSILVLPIGFLAVFLMIFGLEKIVLILLEKIISYLIKIIEFFGGLKFSSIELPFQFGSFEVLLCILALLLFYLANSRALKTLSSLVFAGVFILAFCNKMNEKLPNIIFDDNGQFFAIYDEKLGLAFNKKPRSKNEIADLLKFFKKDSYRLLQEINDEEFKISKFKRINCDKEKCLIESVDKNYGKILILLKRNKISQICDIDSDLIVNLTTKYMLPRCFDDRKKIYNEDFEDDNLRMIFLNS